MNKLTFEQALPMYLKLQKVMLQYKQPESIVKSKRDFETDAENKLKSMLPYITFYGIPDVCLCVYVYLPGETRYPMIDLYVEKNHRNQGYCTKMIRFCKTLSDKLYLNVYDRNTKAISVYNKEGFSLENANDFSVEPCGKLLKMVWNKPHESFVEDYDQNIGFSETNYKFCKVKDLQKGDVVLIDSKFDLINSLPNAFIELGKVESLSDNNVLKLKKAEENHLHKLVTKVKYKKVSPDQIALKVVSQDFGKDLGYTDFELDTYFSYLSKRLWNLIEF